MAVNKELRQEAEDLGIAVDSRWSETTLRERIDEKKADNEITGKSNIVPAAGATYPGPKKEALMGAAVDDKGNVLQTEPTPKAIKGGLPAAGEKALLVAKALQLNIIVDDKWDADRLRGEIQMARMGRADLQVKGAVPPGEWSDVEFDPATKADKQGKLQPGVIVAEPTKVPGVTIAGEPAVVGATGGAVPQSAVVAPEATK